MKAAAVPIWSRLEPETHNDVAYCFKHVGHVGVGGGGLQFWASRLGVEI